MTILAYIHLQEKKTMPVKYADRTSYHVDRATNFRKPTVKPGKKKKMHFNAFSSDVQNNQLQIIFAIVK